MPRWREDADARRGERLARLAADLDTANVGEDFVLLCETALRLCREREMRAGRALDDADSGAALPGLPRRAARSTTSSSCTASARARASGCSAPQKLANGPKVRGHDRGPASRASPTAPAGRRRRR